MKILLTLLFLFVFPFQVFGVNYGNDANCQGYWPMECDGDETDLSGEGETLTETGGDIPQDADKKVGTYSRDFELDDTEYLTHADGGSTDISGSTSLTMVVWFKAEDFTAANEYLIAKDWMAYGLYITTDPNQPAFYLSEDSGWGDQAIGNTLSTGVWTHLAGVYDQSAPSLTIYKNGSVDTAGDNPDTSVDSSIYDSTVAFTVGADGQPDNYYDGLIDDVGIWDRKFTATEVSDVDTYGIDGSLARRVIMISQGYIPLVDFETDTWIWGYDRTPI